MVAIWRNTAAGVARPPASIPEPMLSRLDPDRNVFQVVIGIQLD